MIPAISCDYKLWQFTTIDVVSHVTSCRCDDECHFIWYEVEVKRSASFEVVHDSREDCTHSKWIFTT
jgi:hypothetical protein